MCGLTAAAERYLFFRELTEQRTGRNQIKNFIQKHQAFLSHAVFIFSGFYGHRVNKKLSQMISAADVEQRLLFRCRF